MNGQTDRWEEGQVNKWTNINKRKNKQMDGQRDKQLKGSTDKSIKGMNDKGSHKNEWEVQRKKTKKEITARNKSLMIKPKNKWMNERMINCTRTNKRTKNKWKSISKTTTTTTTEWRTK